MNRKDLTEAKIQLAEERMDLIALLQSGYAGIDKSGKIVDRREHKVVKALAEEPLLSIPKPKVV